MSDNIISFEEYREKKLGRRCRESPLDELFKKDLREQKSFCRIKKSSGLFFDT